MIGVAYLVSLGYIFQWIGSVYSYFKLLFGHQAKELLSILLILLASIDVVKQRRSRNLSVLC